MLSHCRRCLATCNMFLLKRHKTMWYSNTGCLTLMTNKGCERKGTTKGNSISSTQHYTVTFPHASHLFHAFCFCLFTFFSHFFWVILIFKIYKTCLSANNLSLFVYRLIFFDPPNCFSFFGDLLLNLLGYICLVKCLSDILAQAPLTSPALA